MANAPHIIRSVEELRAQVPAILKRLNADQALLLAAAANPVLALEELGYRIPNELHRELDHRIRFSAAERERLAALMARMHEIARGPFDPDDSAELERILFTRLKLPELPSPPVRVPITEAPVATEGPQQLSSRRRGASEESFIGPMANAPTVPQHRLAVRYHATAAGPEPDVLLPLEGKHPIVAPLLEYRAITARHAPFAPRALYDRIRRGSVGGPLLTLRARIHRREG